jgi:hypothetical protein
MLEYMKHVFRGTKLPHDLFVSRLEAKGFLTKQGAKNKSWRLRWFVLDLKKQVLSYFSDERAKAKKLGEVSLRSLCRAVMPPRAEARLNHTLLLVTDQRTYHLRAANERAKVAWFYLLQACTPKSSGPGPDSLMPLAGAGDDDAEA